MKEKKTEDHPVLFTSFRAGIIALVFLVMGFQLALFVYKAAELRILANRDRPDTVYVCPGPAVSSPSLVSTPSSVSIPSGSFVSSSERTAATSSVTTRRNAVHAPLAERIREEKPRRQVESFRFDPNTVSVEDLQRLGFSPKQAASIDNYRSKGGRFRRKEDFAKSYVVADSVYRRLEAYIDIPLLDINRADSAAFDALPGIGGYFAAKMVFGQILLQLLA